ncbi:hypothetical protein J6590_032831 [Homalodisca vitripennis]|nr:hypothetical protein J6590_032831 [Homalodisca vitripennis]
MDFAKVRPMIGVNQHVSTVSAQKSCSKIFSFPDISNIFANEQKKCTPKWQTTPLVRDRMSYPRVRSGPKAQAILVTAHEPDELQMSSMTTTTPQRKVTGFTCPVLSQCG